MSEVDFQRDTWGSFKNPFRFANVPQLGTPSSYRGERPLFKPLTDSASVHVNLNYNPANTVHEFPAAAVPTFATLRSFYRTPYHVYATADGPTIFERGMDHVALTQPVPASGQFLSPGATPPGLKSQTSYRPVLDRVLYVLSVGLSQDPSHLNELRVIITPIVTLWNPYNVALEIEGAVTYPWLEMYFLFTYNYYDQANQKIGSQTINPTHLLGAQFGASNMRSVNPYFFASITPDGSGTAGGGRSIRFQPGEVRVFMPANPDAQEILATGSVRERTLNLRPVENVAQMTYRSGFAVPLVNASVSSSPSRVLAATESVQVTDFKTSSNYDVFIVGLEDATRAKLPNPTNNDRGQSVSDVQSMHFGNPSAPITSPILSFAQVSDPTQRVPFGMIETYHRVATDAAAYRKSDLVYTTNPRQAHINGYLTNGTFVTGPHYETMFRGISSYNDAIQVTNGGRDAYYGATNSAAGGMTHLAFFEAPRSSPLSLAAFQHADLAGTSYSPANQFGNSWASAYLTQSVVANNTPPVSATTTGSLSYSRAAMPVYDYSYLANESLWDAFFFSGAAPALQPGTISGSPSVWDSDVARVTQDYKNTLTKFIDDPSNNPLRDPRMHFHAGSATASGLKTDLVKPEGCLQIAAHLQVDGAFNINSTSEKAWSAFLSGMRNLAFDVTEDPMSAATTGSNSPGDDNTAFPRFRHPLGTANDHWMGFRSLNDTQVADLAKKLVAQVRKRGPFLSLGEFVNRRIDSSNMGLKGAIQAAIDDTGFNSASLYDTFDTSGYPADGKANISPPNTGVGIPGYLTQADVLQSIAPVMTARSDTFTLRGYGEAKDSSGKVLASTWCEAVVQRMPEFVDPADPPHTAMADLNKSNQTFGRRFSIVSFRYLAKSEVGL